ncbi:hypothetical protein OIU85_004018 [Salix viminalis]|uniref:PAP/OAS1 substrate-binding-related domain-containing protein n=1 Tax=Salix viminalis TaxID=40686 RepID=A0A9Q0PRV8_SALVM|nr:hypothetical protein OIU85_004018 [Salix viminalis]
MGGPSTLCFLEQVDQLIGRDHLFKRSVILIKAWCFYESRILGAHHGLISAYALQILVLNIINNFHSSLSGPLAVLYKFLDYYSTFDWDNYCVSINGPVPVSSFPQMGNFHRIRGALSYGAQRLAEIIALPGEAMGARLEKFFMNTLDRNGKGQRPDADVPVPAFGTGRSEASDLSGDYDKYYSGLLHGQRYHNYPLPVPPQPSLPSSPSQIKQKSARDVLPQLLQSKQNIFSRRGTDVFLPRPQCHPYASQLQGAASGIDITRKSRGTGTYIPDVCHNRYKDLLLWMIDNPDSTHRPLSMIDQAEESPKTEKSEDGNCLNIPPNQISPETEKSEDGSCLDLSLDQFPLLPSSNKSMSSEIHQSYQNITEACQAKDCSSTLGNIQFGSFQSQPSLQGVPSSVVRKQAGSGVSITIVGMPAVVRT